MFENLLICENRHKLRSPWSELINQLLACITYQEINNSTCIHVLRPIVTFLITLIIHLVYFINCSWDTDINKLDDFLLDPFCIYNKYAMFWFEFSVKNYTNKIMFKLIFIAEHRRLVYHG